MFSSRDTDLKILRASYRNNEILLQGNEIVSCDLQVWSHYLDKNILENNKLCPKSATIVNRSTFIYSDCHVRRPDMGLPIFSTILHISSLVDVYSFTKGLQAWERPSCSCSYCINDTVALDVCPKGQNSYNTGFSFCRGRGMRESPAAYQLIVCWYIS